MKADQYPLFAHAVKEFRESQQMTQERFAHKLGVTVSAVQKWEAGVNLPEWRTISKLLVDFGERGWVLLNAMGMRQEDIARLCRGFLSFPESSRKRTP